MKTFIHLPELDLPHIRVYDTGEIQNLNTGNFLKPCNGYVDVYTFETKQHFHVAVKQLYGYCFRAPWRQSVIIPHKRLTDLGFSQYYALVDGRIFGLWKMDYLKESISEDGYRECVLTDDSKHLHYFKTHQIIARAFIPNPEGKTTINHIDGNKLNNHVSNLEWMWMWENLRHALDNGLKHCAMTVETVHGVCKCLEQGMSRAAICQKFNIAPSNITDILDGCHYRISRLYNNIPYLPSARHIPIEFRQN